jgi:hypothetical protein
MSYSLSALYRSVGISKQAVTQYAVRQEAFNRQVSHLIMEADELRRAHPGCGVQKMYDTLQPTFIGRDRFIELFMAIGYRIKRVRNGRITTRSAGFYYDNLIAGLEIRAPDQVWQSDITYIRVGERFYYAVFIIDVYTKEIVGYQVSDHMRSTANMRALRMALQGYQAPKIHHSDRGSQYIYTEYTSLLKSHDTQISMGMIAQENAYAERINGTIKNEFIGYWKPKDYNQLKRQVAKAVNYYNTNRPHNHLCKMTPMKFRDYVMAVELDQRPVETIFNFENLT